MKLQIYRFKCGQCGVEFKSPKTIVGGYGEFMLRSVGAGEIAYLNALEDKTYDEVEGLLRTNSRIAGKGDNAYADILQNTYGDIACDVDQTGESFRIGALPKCPQCGVENILSWEEIVPPEFVDKRLSPVTHSEWDGLSYKEKEGVVDQALQKFGY